jgi:16S rRNA (cytosine1402-N4)-methyltransferase
VTTPHHLPVLLDEVVRELVPQPWDADKESLWLDGTLGLGGHATAILMAAGPKSSLLGLDKDGQARAEAEKILHKFGSRVRIVASGFEDMKGPGREVLAGRVGYDGILMDLGISSMQLDTGERGFSFRQDAPLDMRMDQQSGLSAAEWIRRQDEASLKQVLREYGEEPRAGAIARSILKAQPQTTKELADAVLRIGWPHRDTHPATRTFQAIRIAVNGELESLQEALPQALDLLKGGGRLAVISFHSLEDRLVKQYMAEESRDCICPPSFPECRCSHRAKLRKVLRKAASPSEDEAARNPRSRSAKLRVAEKL